MAGFRKKMRQKLQGKNVGGLLQPDAAADAIKPFDSGQSSIAPSTRAPSPANPPLTELACVATSSVVLGSVDPTPSAAPSSPPPADLLPPAPSTPTPSLWDRAYDDLRKEESRLVEEYEKLLAQEVKAAGSESRDESSTAPVLPQDTTLSPNLQSRQAQLDTVITRGCLRMEEKKGKYSIAGHEFVLVDQVAQAAKFVQWAKDWIGDAVAASPEASIAWSGICLILPLLTNPQTTEEANHDGFIYVTARMRYYTVFEPLLQKLGQNGGVSDALMVETNNHVVSLYQRILEFQIRSVLRFYKSRLKTYAGDAILPYDWEKAIQKIKQQEDMVNEILSQINQFASRNELEILDKASRDAHKTMKDLLLVQEQQLQVQTAQLRLQEDASRQILSDKQNACLQLFYLTNNNKGATYEWYKSRVDERVKDTCMWFLEHDNFQAWLNQDAGPLLVSADPGCGKSVLAKYLIDHILRQRSATVCYYFFKDQDQNTARQALCALLHQLFCARPILIEHAMGPYEERGQRLIESTESLWSIFTTAVRDTRAGRITVVLDALDECAEEEFRDLMQNINGQFTLGDATRPHEAKLKFLMTSRPYEQILSRFRRLSGAFPCIRIPGEDESEKISQEINQVIHYRVDELAREERLSDQIKRHLKDKLLSIEHRTYLWVYLVFDHLRTGFKKTTKGIDATIQTLPKSVNQAYEQILNRSRDDRMVPKVLRIVLAAHRPMTVEEMNIAVNVDSKSKSFDDLDLEDAEDFKSHLRSWCGLFISVHHNKIYFLHQTAREFLLPRTNPSPSPTTLSSASRWQHSITLRDAHATLADICVHYLSLFDSSTLLPTEDDARRALLDYSALYWGTHFREADVADDAAIVTLALNLCTRDRKSNSMWSAIYRRHRQFISPKHMYGHIAASTLGLTSVTRRLPSSYDDLRVKDNEGRTPLCIAVERGHVDIVQVLLEKGADIEATDDVYGTPLYIAVERGRTDIVQLLLEKGANIEATDDVYGAPLCIAVERGHVNIVQVLLEKGADIEATDDIYGTPLYIAVVFGHINIIQLLLEKGADIEATDDIYGTPLCIAVERGHVDIVQLLLEKGADIEATNDFGETPLIVAVGSNKELIVECLIKKGADVNAKTCGSTPLICAAEKGYITAVRMLLERGASVNVKDEDDFTPLMRAAMRGHVAVVQLLFDNSAIVTEEDVCGIETMSCSSSDDYYGEDDVDNEAYEACVELMKSYIA